MTNQWDSDVIANKRAAERQDEAIIAGNPSYFSSYTNIFKLKSAIQKIEDKLKEIDTALRQNTLDQQAADSGGGPSLEVPMFLSFETRTNIFGGTVRRQLTRAEVIRIQTALLAEKTDLSRQLSRQQDIFIAAGGGRSPDATTTTTQEEVAPPITFSETVLYNVSSVNESYFNPDMSFVNKADPDWLGKGATDRYDNVIWSGNTPGKVNDARDLWQNSLASNSKGMIQTWLVPDGQGTTTNVSLIGDATSVQRYGFQFLYNPTSIEMNYGGVPEVDVTMMSSGLEEYNLSNPSVYQSTINVQVVINRMFDFNYINETGIKNGQISDFYSGNVPTTKDLQEIYKKGTMYDIEFLLRTMLLPSFKSQLRGDTTDIGYLTGAPVEFHLGNNLRYVAIIGGIGVNHVIFDKRMVPLFTTISISANRVPDPFGASD